MKINRVKNCFIVLAVLEKVLGVRLISVFYVEEFTRTIKNFIRTIVKRVPGLADQPLVPKPWSIVDVQHRIHKGVVVAFEGESSGASHD
jgi:hypothetical protein